jgi:phosphonate transport system substrate-binding protein
MRSWLFFVLVLVLSGPVNAADRELYLGSVAMDTPAAMVERLTPLAKYLSDETGLKIMFRPSPNLGSVVYDLGAGYTQIAYLTPVAYVNAHDKFNAQPLASVLEHGQSSFMLQLVTRTESPIKTAADLRGRKFAFGDEKALLHRAVVYQAGLKLEDFSSYAFLKHYDQVAEAVLRGDFDAGILIDSETAKYKSRGLRVVYSSARLPSYVFAVNAAVPPDVVEKLQQALYNLKRDTEAHTAILDKFNHSCDGFSTVKDEDYDVVREMVKPFRK